MATRRLERTARSTLAVLMALLMVTSVMAPAVAYSLPANDGTAALDPGVETNTNGTGDSVDDDTKTTEPAVVSSNVRELVATARAGEDDSSLVSQSSGETRITVTVEAVSGQASAAADAVAAYGDITNRFGGKIEASLPPGAIEAVADASAVSAIRRPDPVVRADRGVDVSEGLSNINSTSGRLGAGVNGSGVTVAVANLDWYLASRRLPVDSPETVEPGPVQLDGRAVPLGEFVPSSVTQTDALAYRASTREEYAVLGRGYASSTWSAVSVADGATRFGVVDPTALERVADGADAAAEGRELPATLRAELDDPDVELPADARSIAVDATAAEFPLLFPTSRLLGTTPAGSTLDGLERTIPAEPGTTVPVADELARGTRSRPREYSERRLDAGDPVYVLGTARETADGELEIGADPDGPPFVVTRLTAAEATAHVRRFCRTYGVLGLLALAAGAGLIASVGL